MQWTGFREKIAAVMGILVIVAAFIGLAIAFGWDIPGVSAIANMLGIQR